MTEIRLICRLNYPMESIVRIVGYLWLLNEANLRKIFVSSGLKYKRRMVH